MKKKVTVFFWFIILIFFLFLFLLFGLVFSYFRLEAEKKIEEEERDSSFKYKITRYDPYKDETLLGVMSTNEEIGEEGFITYQTEEGDHVLISREELMEYECVGSCWCEDGESRRISSIPLHRPMFVLLAAISTLVVIDKAKDHFHKKCTELASSDDDDFCRDSTSVRSVVDYCKKIISKFRKEKPIPLVTVDNQYLCEGYCVPDGDMEKRVRKLDFWGDYDDDVTSSMLDRIKLCKTYRLTGIETWIRVPSQLTFPQRLNHVKIEFDENFLKWFCEENGRLSKTEFDILFGEEEEKKKKGGDDVDEKNEKEGEDVFEIKSWCFSKSQYNPYENIFCRPISDDDEEEFSEI